VGLVRQVRLTIVLTHPVQYFAPLFRQLAQDPAIELTVLHAIEPTAAQQGVGFGQAFAWDTPLHDGYRSQVVRPARAGDDVGSARLFGVDVPEIGAAIAQTRPDVVLLTGWHSATQLRALVWCRRAGVPLLYRGDSTLDSAPVGLRHAAWAAKTRLMLGAFAAYLSVGVRARAYLERFGRPTSPIIDSPHAVDNQLFAQGAQPHQVGAARQEARAALGAGDEELLLLYVGKLEQKKRVQDLIEAAARLPGAVRVAIVGAGAEEASLRALAAERRVAVTFAGFWNQSALPRAYAAADCLVLPSDGRETWGLVVNEALATGLPCVVSDQVGCAPDLIDDQVGGVHPCGQPEALAGVLRRVRARLADGHDYGAACRSRVERYSLAAAADGVREAAHAAAARPRVVLCAGGMVAFTGLERMTFGVLRALREGGAATHCIVNDWEHERIVEAARDIGATWSVGRWREHTDRHVRDPRQLARIAWDVAYDNAVLLRDAYRMRATHVMIPEFIAGVRFAPALALLRRRGVRVVMRLGNAPAAHPVHRWFWRRVVAPTTDVFVANSEFLRRELCATLDGVDARVIANAPTARAVPSSAPASRDPTKIVYVGQLIPEKGVDLLLDAAGLLIARGRPVTLDVVGRLDGWEAPKYRGYRDGLRARAAAPDLDGHVHFLGWREDVAAVMAQAAIHCVPSRLEQKEGMAGVVLEAKQAGIPSVVTPSGALSEMVRDGLDGCIAREASAQAIADGLERLLADPSLRQRAAEEARRSLNQFSRERFASAWQAVFAC
jgi:glycosyltransferase involved in cell wall biosynthesis